MLSVLPKLADRNFILGFFLPTVLFALVALALFSDLQNAQALVQQVLAKDFVAAAYAAFAVWVIAVALLTLNHPLYRLLEGYIFPRSFADALKRRKAARLQRQLDEIQTLYRRFKQEGDTFPDADRTRYEILKKETVASMPSSAGEVLPTDFGNAIRAFELYPRDVYGADGVYVWLRLATVVPASVVANVEDARTQVDFLINCCVFSVIVAALALGRVAHALYTQQIPNGHPVAAWLLFAAGGLFAAWLFYRWAVTRVPAWGDWVRAAFDCYLPDLAKQIGYTLPDTDAQRVEFWRAFSRQLIYGRYPDGEPAFKVEDWVKPSKKPEQPPQSPAADTVVVVDVGTGSEPQ